MSPEQNTGSAELLTYAVGDVHGCLNKLDPLLERCIAHAAGAPMRFVFLGDYIDRGPNSRGVVERVKKLQSEMTDVICLRGNHEALLLEAIDTRDEGLWLMNGGEQTLASYSVDGVDDLPRDHLDWMRSLKLAFDDGLRFFVHAGVNPRVALNRQTEHDLVWIREPFLSSDADHGRLVVHGHTPLATGRPDLRRNRLNLDTAAVFGGALSAAVFNSQKTAPLAFVNHFGAITAL